MVLNDLLISIPAAQLSMIEQQHELVLDTGAFMIESDNSAEEAVIVAQVGQTQWSLLPAMPTMKVGDATYMFALPNGAFYSVTLAEDTEDIAFGCLEALLESTTLYRESERLLADKQAQEGDAKLAAKLAALDPVQYPQQPGRTENYTSEGASAGPSHVAYPTVGEVPPQATAPPAQATKGLSKGAAAGGSTSTAVLVVPGDDKKQVQAVPTGGPMSEANKNLVYKSKTASRIQHVSGKAASGILISAAYASAKISEGGENLKGRMTPLAEPVKLSPSLKKRLHRTNQVARVLAKGANAVVNGVVAVSTTVADAILWGLGVHKPKKAKEGGGTAGEKRLAAMVAYTEVYDAMEAAGSQVLKASKDTTGSVIEHKYGAEAAAASTEAIGSAAQLGDAALGLRKVGVKAIARATAKKTYKGIAKHLLQLHKQEAEAATDGNAAANAAAAAVPVGNSASNSMV